MIVGNAIAAIVWLATVIAVPVSMTLFTFILLEGISGVVIHMIGSTVRTVLKAASSLVEIFSRIPLLISTYIYKLFASRATLGVLCEALALLLWTLSMGYLSLLFFGIGVYLLSDLEVLRDIWEAIRTLVEDIDAMSYIVGFVSVAIVSVLVYLQQYTAAVFTSLVLVILLLMANFFDAARIVGLTGILALVMDDGSSYSNLTWSAMLVLFGLVAATSLGIVSLGPSRHVHGGERF